MNVLIVCTGNVCRSPVAQALLEDTFDSSVTVTSAGLNAPANTAVAAPMAELLLNDGIDPHHLVTRSLTAQLIADADLILTMTRDQRARVVRRDPTAVRRTFTLIEFSRLVGGNGEKRPTTGGRGNRTAKQPARPAPARPTRTAPAHSAPGRPSSVRSVFSRSTLINSSLAKSILSKLDSSTPVVANLPETMPIPVVTPKRKPSPTAPNSPAGAGKRVQQHPESTRPVPIRWAPIHPKPKTDTPLRVVTCDAEYLRASIPHAIGQRAQLRAGAPDLDIADPMGRSVKVHRRIYHQIQQTVEVLVDGARALPQSAQRQNTANQHAAEVRTIRTDQPAWASKITWRGRNNPTNIRRSTSA